MAKHPLAMQSERHRSVWDLGILTLALVVMWPVLVAARSLLGRSTFALHWEAAEQIGGSILIFQTTANLLFAITKSTPSIGVVVGVCGAVVVAATVWQAGMWAVARTIPGMKTISESGGLIKYSGGKWVPLAVRVAAETAQKYLIIMMSFVAEFRG